MNDFTALGSRWFCDDGTKGLSIKKCENGVKSCPKLRDNTCRRTPRINHYVYFWFWLNLLSMDGRFTDEIK